MIWIIVVGIFVAWFALSCAIGTLVGQMFAMGRRDKDL